MNNIILMGQENCLYGTSVDGLENTLGNIPGLLERAAEARIKFVSFEPLIVLPDINFSDFSKLDWIIIGADSSRGAIKPRKVWADYLIEKAREYDIPVFVKNNYKYPERIKQFPEVA